MNLTDDDLQPWFYGLVVLALFGFWLDFRFKRYLKKNHSDLFYGLGLGVNPFTLSIAQHWNRYRNLWRFLKDREYLQARDEKLSQMAQVLLYFNRFYLAYFVSLPIASLLYTLYTVLWNRP